VRAWSDCNGGLAVVESCRKQLDRAEVGRVRERWLRDDSCCRRGVDACWEVLGAPVEEEERDTECVRLRECWVADAGETGVCAASRACKGWEVPPLERMAAAVAARGGEGRLPDPAGLEPGLCSLAEPPHPQGQLVMREAAGLLLY